MSDQLPQKSLTTPIPKNETQRLAALHRYQILDTPPEVAFDRITTLAARLFNLPTALISLVDESRAWFKSCVGFDTHEVAREVTLCSFTMLTEELLIVPDTRLDERFACNPIVQSEPGMRFYAGAPLLSSDGFNLGTLCLLDTQPHEPLNAEQQATLVDLAAMVVDELELRLAAQKIAQSEEKYCTLFESIAEGFCIVEVLFEANETAYDHRIVQANPAFERHTGIPKANGKTASELAPGVEQYWNDLYAQVVHTGESVRVENRSDALGRWFDVQVSRLGDASTRQVAIVLNDITERKQAEAALQESESRLRLALKIGKLGSWQLDLKTNELHTSEQCKANFGFSYDADFSHQALFERMHPEDRAWIEAAIEQAIEQHTDYDVEYRNVWDDGSIHWVLVRGCTFYDSNDTGLQMMGMSLDITERKQAQAALQESEAQSRNILESITDAFFALDENWQFTYVNRAAETLLNRTRGDLIGQSIWQAYPGLVGSKFEQLYWQVMRERVAGSVTAFYPDHNRWYEVHVYPASTGITIYFRNVTEQIQTAAILRQSEERYRTLFESIDEGFCVVEVLLDANDTPIDYRILEVNPTFEQQTGLYQAVGKTARQLNLEEHWIAIYGRVALTGESIRFENGSATLKRWFDVYACRTGEKEARKVAIVFKDISDRKQTEAVLQEQSRLLQLIVDNIGDGLILANPQGDLLLVNQAAERIFGSLTNEHSCDEWSQTYGLFLPDQQTLFPDEQLPLYRAIRGEQANDVEVFVRREPGCEGRWISISGFPVLNTSDEIAGGVITCRDVTERKYILQQEQTAREAAERANRIKDEFLAVLSHELRSPLNPILGWTRLLQNGKLDETRQREALATIERNAKLQTQLIEDLLDISRIMQGKLSLTIAPVSLTFVITAAVETVRLAAEAKNIQILLDLTSATSPVSGDAARLQQVVWNLLTNAVKFAPRGGQVTVELRQFEGIAQIRVLDTGKGINQQFLPYVFEYFRQEDGSTTRKFGGLGLGLAIVRQIVEMHGGTVKAESKGEHQGATFTVQLPIIEQAAPILSQSSQAPAENTAEPLRNLQILVVDDDADAREFQAFLLEQSGAKVIAVASGLEALQVLKQFIPDVLVSDIGMAQMDGYMLMQLLRERPPNQGGTIRALALTAYAAEVDQQRAIQAGFEAFITKPVEPETLVQAIITLLKRNQQ